jgi:hypothetical protein
VSFEHPQPLGAPGPTSARSQHPGARQLAAGGTRSPTAANPAAMARDPCTSATVQPRGRSRKTTTSKGRDSRASPSRSAHLPNETRRANSPLTRPKPPPPVTTEWRGDPANRGWRRRFGRLGRRWLRQRFGRDHHRPVQAREDQPRPTMQDDGRRRDRDPRMGRLVQPRPTALCVRQVASDRIRLSLSPKTEDSIITTASIKAEAVQTAFSVPFLGNVFSA